MRPSWRNAANAAALVGVLQTAPTAVVECTLRAGADARVFRVLDAGSAREPRWWLTLRSRALGERVVELPLPNARVERSAKHLAIWSTSKNGGLMVTVRTGPDQPILDVFVNFELEVNVWPDLSPDVEHMNTHGPQTGPRCRVLSSPQP